MDHPAAGPAEASGRSTLTPAEIACWPIDAALPSRGDHGQPLRRALERHGHWHAWQVAGRHLPIGCVALEVTQRCNLDCQLCYLSEHSEAVRDLPLEEIFRRIDMIERRFGPGTNVQITGGDPTLRPGDELVAIVRRLRARSMRPALFTNGIRASRDLLVALAEAGLEDVAFHVDMTQQRRGYASEAALNEVRRDYIERARNLGLEILFDTTVTEANLSEIPDLVRFFVAHADAVHLASFQLQADTGRGVLRRRGSLVDRATLIELINGGAGVDLGFDYPQIGHPDCNRYSGCLVAGSAVAPLFEDAAFFARLLACTEGYGFDRRDRWALGRVCLKIALRHSELWWPALVYAGRKFWQLRRGLVRSRGRVNKLSFYIHDFMDADRLDRARCESCVFMAMTRDGPISMCVHNARRDDFILQPVQVTTGNGTRLWDPLEGQRSGCAKVPEAQSHGLKRVKGRTRATLLVERAG